MAVSKLKGVMKVLGVGVAGVLIAYGVVNFLSFDLEDPISMILPLYYM